MSPQKSLSKKTKKKLDFWHQPLSPRVFWPLLGVLCLFFIISLINFYSLWQLKSDLKNILSEIKSEETYLDNSRSQSSLAQTPRTNLNIVPTTIKTLDLNALGKIVTEPALQQQNLGGTVLSFSDSFTDLIYIDLQNSDLFWAENVGAFTLPPVYSLTKQSDCANLDCGLSRAEIDPISLCLTNGCLRKSEDNKLFFKDRVLLLPPELEGEVIRELTIFALKAKWLIGIVTGVATQERAWVYSFDGLAFSPLITDSSDHQIYSRYRRGGGKVFFGGDDNDFLILYPAYDAAAFRWRNNNIEDISRFFDLQVLAASFSAQIFKLREKGETNYYICGLSEHRPLLMKIWSQDEESSGGALDFSPLYFKNNFQAEQILCARSNVNSLAIAARKGGSQELWNFTDLGFDHSKVRQVRSVNLQSREVAVKAAVIADMEIIANGSDYSFSLSNKANNFQAINPYLWHYFEEENDEIYWQLTIQPGENNYRSPWFSHVNRLDYLLIN